MKRQLLFIMMVLLSLSANADDGGRCGDNLIWDYKESTRTLTFIGSGWMQNATSSSKVPWNKYKKTVEKVVLSEDMTSLCNFCFWEFTSIKSITIPKNIGYMGQYAFYGCSNLSSVYISDLFSWCNISFIDSSSNPLYVAHHLYLNDEEVKDLLIPDDVTSIKNYTFCSCSSLTSVTIPNSVTSIGTCAFDGCEAISSLTIPNSVTSINDYAFRNCKFLESLNLPSSLTSIGKYTFSNCRIFTNLTLPNSVTSIGENAFSNCYSITTINIPGSLKSIGKDAFQNCINLSSVNISDLSSWCKLSFENVDANPLSYAHRIYSDENTEIKNLVIPEGVPGIGDYAFYSCTGIDSATIPSSVKSIGKSAFYGCSCIKDVYCYAKDVPETKSDAFQAEIIANSTLYVPENSIKSYKATSPWAYFGEVMPIDNNMTYTLIYIVDGEVYKTYEVECGSEITPEEEPSKEGYTFSGWSYIPPTMPAADVVIMGTFKINNYTLTYEVDGEKYKSYEVEYGTIITPEPEPIKEGYTFSGWSEIPETMPAYDVTVRGTFTKDILGKCATPTISYANGEVTFNCETEDVTFIYDTVIEDKDIKGGIGNKLQFSVTYHISVYAQKEDYYDSEVATGTLCWIDVAPQTEGIVDEDAVMEVKAMPVLIQTQGGTISIQGAAEGTPIAVYDIEGKQYGSTIAEKDRATITTSLRPGSIAVVKIGEKAVKVAIK